MLSEVQRGAVLVLFWRLEMLSQMQSPHHRKEEMLASLRYTKEKKRKRNTKL